MSLTHFSIGAALAISALIGGCTKTAGEVLYCSLDVEGGNWREGAMHIDLERGLIYGGDTSSTIYPFVTGDFAGFAASFPLLLFSDSVDPIEIQSDIVLDDIVLDDIVFRVSPIEGSFGDLWLIIARPREAGSEQEALQRSVVLYSIADGVLSMSFSGFIGEEVFPVNYVPCSNRTLRYDDLRLFSDQPVESR